MTNDNQELSQEAKESYSWSAQDIADLFDIDERHIHEWAAQGLITSTDQQGFFHINDVENFVDQHEAQVLALVRSTPQHITQLYRHFDAGGELLYVGISLHAVVRLTAHKSQSAWFKDIVRIEIENYSSRMEAIRAEIEAIKTEKPIYNVLHNED